MKKYSLINNITGWGVFVVAAMVYLLTIEPTASFWDCGEFITSAYKLEVGHPPGAPFFMLVANLFTQFASDTSQVAKMVNSMSALLSAFTILFLFWSITHLTRKLICTGDNKNMSLWQIITIMGSGVVGALAYTFSDTFWFSAVEGEVYAFSSMLTALVFWLILKWEDNAHKPHSDKWLVLIAYIVGLSIGVHLLNLLCIPAIVLVYYFKKSETRTYKGVLGSLLVSFGLVAVLLFGIIPGFTKVGGWFELLFVNTFGLPYNTGVLAYLILLVGFIVWSLFESIAQKGNLKRAKIAFVASLALSGALFISSSPWLWIVLIALACYMTFMKKSIQMRFVNITMSSLLVVLIGFSAYALIPIRSSANPPLDLNSPEDVFSLGSYLNREQYGETPRLHGVTYASKVKRKADGSPIIASEKKSYSRVVKASPDEKDRYVVSKIPKYEYTNTMLFPRMHSHSGLPNFNNHLIGYRQWGDVENENRPPSFIENLKFLFSYQINYMYWRYFMWNFSGRQNDIQGDGGITSGNWITGIPLIDRYVLQLGPQDNIAPDIVNNKGRNQYFMLPLLLGILGIVFQLKRKERGFENFLIVFMLFFMTGLAIVLYLNQTPFEPRERDYAYAGSFYAFAIWIGIGVAYVSSLLKKYIQNPVVSSSLATAVCLCVPILMGTQNWDDHDRSGRYLARDTGMNYLSCVGENGIIFTNGDNDTYPLWYVQETEGFRTDVRVANIQFMQTEWYIDQMVRQAYESDPLPITWSRYQYSSDRGSAAFVVTKNEIKEALRRGEVPPVSYGMYYDANAFKDTLSLEQTLENLKTGKNIHPKNPFNTGETAVIPGDLLSMDVNVELIDWESMHATPSNKMFINLGGKSFVSRHELMMMEILKNVNKANWKQSVHFATTIDPNLYMNLRETNMSLNGLTYQVVPGKPLGNGVNTDAAFENMMNFRWGGLENNPDIYLDETCRRMISTFRHYFTTLVDALIYEGKRDKALAALEKATSAMPSSAVAYRNEGVLFARGYYQLGEKEKADKLINEIAERLHKNLDWFDRLSPRQIADATTDVRFNNLYPMMLIASVYQQYNRDAYASIIDNLLQRAQYYYSIGLPFLGDFIVSELTNESIRAYYRGAGKDASADASDTSELSIEEQTMEKTLHLMQQYSPRLLQQYTTHDKE